MDNRKMGYIHPKRIKDIMLNNESFGTTFYTAVEIDDDIKKKNLLEDEEIKKRKDILQTARHPWNCPMCNKIMIKKIDSRFWYRKGMCFDCVITLETYLKVVGKYDEYENQTVLRNYKAFLLDIKVQAEEFLLKLKDDITVVNHDGTFDSMSGGNVVVRDFMTKELDDINTKLLEVEDVDLNINIEQYLNLNFNEILTSIRHDKTEKNNGK